MEEVSGPVKLSMECFLKEGKWMIFLRGSYWMLNLLTGLRRTGGPTWVSSAHNDERQITSAHYQIYESVGTEAGLLERAHKAEAELEVLRTDRKEALMKAFYAGADRGHHPESTNILFEEWWSEFSREEG